MENQNKYGLLQLKKQFGTEAQCLKVIFEANHSYECSCGGTYTPLKGRRQYQCSKCRFQIAPTAGTIFHKSDTPLTLWFYAIFLFSTAKSGLSAKQLQRSLGVTYKCAYRILSLIRKALGQDKDKLSGTVEVDAGYFGGVKKAGANNKYLSESMQSKAVVIAAIERGGKMRAKVIPGATSTFIQQFIRENVDTSATLMTDASPTYIGADRDYNRETVIHKRKEYVRGNAHVNTIETFFGHLKRSIRGSFKSVSRQELQNYLDAFVFHYNMRHSDRLRFSSLLDALLRPAKQQKIELAA